MKKILILLLAFLAVSIAAADTFYLIDDGVAKQRNPWDKGPSLEGRKHVTVIGAIKRPGVYFFTGTLSLADLIELAGIGVSAAGETSYIEATRLISSEGSQVKDSVTINVRKLLTSEKRSSLWILEGNEIIYIPAMMGL